MHLGNIWPFWYFNAHRISHFEKRPLPDKLPRNKSLPWLVWLVWWYTWQPWIETACLSHFIRNHPQTKDYSILQISLTTSAKVILNICLHSQSYFFPVFTVNLFHQCSRYAEIERLHVTGGKCPKSSNRLTFGKCHILRSLKHDTKLGTIAHTSTKSWSKLHYIRR